MPTWFRYTRVRYEDTSAIGAAESAAGAPFGARRTTMKATALMAMTTVFVGGCAGYVAHLETSASISDARAQFERAESCPPTAVVLAMAARPVWMPLPAQAPPPPEVAASPERLAVYRKNNPPESDEYRRFVTATGCGHHTLYECEGRGVCGDGDTSCWTCQPIERDGARQ